jgi:hypothetical protein
VEEELKELARSLAGGARRTWVIVADLAKPGAAEKLCQGRAGISTSSSRTRPCPRSGKLDKFTQHRGVERALRVNSRVSRADGPGSVPSSQKGEGHIVFYLVALGQGRSPRASLYNATKFGLRGFAFGLTGGHVPRGSASRGAPGLRPRRRMFHDSAKAPMGLGSTTPKKVARASRARSGETSTRSRWRLGGALIHRVRLPPPEIAARVQRRGGADEIADTLRPVRPTSADQVRAYSRQAAGNRLRR